MLVRKWKWWRQLPREKRNKHQRTEHPTTRVSRHTIQLQGQINQTRCHHSLSRERDSSPQRDKDSLTLHCKAYTIKFAPNAEVSNSGSRARYSRNTIKEVGWKQNSFQFPKSRSSATKLTKITATQFHTRDNHERGASQICPWVYPLASKPWWSKKDHRNTPASGGLQSNSIFGTNTRATDCLQIFLRYDEDFTCCQTRKNKRGMHR